MKRTVVLIMLSVLSFPVFGQRLSELYYADNPQDKNTQTIQSDTTLFYRPIAVEPVFEQFARYGFGFVSYSRRGEYPKQTSLRIGNALVRNPFGRYDDYSLASLLRRLPSTVGYTYSDSPAIYGADLRGERFDFKPSLLPPGHSLRLQYADRNYRAAATLRSVGALGNGWLYSCAAGGRWGRDGYVQGLFTDEMFLSAALQKGGFCGLLIASPVERSVRGWCVEECFDLSGNNLYNPSWGWSDGRVRASRVRREFLPIVMLGYDFELSEHTAMSVSAMVRVGERSAGSLSWYDAANPLPDYYASLPGGYADPALARYVADLWADSDERYTQIDWDSLYRINSLSDHGAVYAVTDDVERSAESNITLSASTQLSERLTADWGAEVDFARGHFFNRASDLLGADSLSAEADSYDYTIRDARMSAYVTMRYMAERTDASLSLSLSDNTIARAAELSQRKLNFTAVSGKATLLHRLSSRGNLSAAISFNQSFPYYGDLFLAPERHSKSVGKAAVADSFGAETAYSLTAGIVRLSAAAYIDYSLGRSRIIHFYDDFCDTYCSMVWSGIATRHCGFEFGAQVDLTSALELSAAVGLNSYRYISSSVVDIFGYEDGCSTVSSEQSDVSGMVSDSSPQVVAALKLSYLMRCGVRLGVETDVAAERYMLPSPLYHTHYLLDRLRTTEERTAFTAQQRLPSAATVNLFVYKRFGALALSLSVRNLLSDRNIVYGGYLQSRVASAGTDEARSYAPFAAKYSYAYPRHIYLTASYEF